ncbi:hypothetical protein LXL04_002774 [Taraxacum kok-saghyz]
MSDADALISSVTRDIFDTTYVCTPQNVYVLEDMDQCLRARTHFLQTSSRHTREDIQQRGHPTDVYHYVSVAQYSVWLV